MEEARIDVGSWLRGLGLAQYEALFRDNEFEADVLADLTESDLEKIGLPLGLRKRVVKAVRQSQPDRGAAMQPPASRHAIRRRLGGWRCAVSCNNEPASHSLAAKSCLFRILSGLDFRLVVENYIQQ
jgi:hypothetical protein